MLELTSAGRPVRLSPGTSVQLEFNSPLFDEAAVRGSFSYSFGVPARPNGPLYGFPERPDAAGEPGGQLPGELSDDGVLLLCGTQRVRSASPAKYGVSLVGGLGAAELSGRTLASFAYGGLREVPRRVPVAGQPGVLAPGLVLHANEVVANPDAYGYVFAPLRNEYVDPKAPVVPTDPLFYPAETVNRWVVSDVAQLGMPAGGCFTYSVNFQIPGLVTFEDFALPPRMCPFPRLRYVLQCICQESGLPVDTLRLLPGELGELVVVGSAQLVDRGDAATLRFSLADVLPALTVAELLAALRQDWGIVLAVDPLTQQVHTCYLRELVAASADAVDLTHLLAGAPEAAMADVPGLTLTSRVDEADALTQGLLGKQPAAALVLLDVATVADLPATALLTENPRDGQMRLVRQLDTYYTCTVAYLDAVRVTLTWKEWVLALPPVQVNGGGAEQAQGLCYTAELPTRVTTYPDVVSPVPALSQPPYRADQDVVERSSVLRLLFYRGRQLAGYELRTYPQLSHRSPSGASSVRLSGGQGTYAQWLHAWLRVKLAGTVYKQPLRLTALDLARLDLTRKVRLDGVEYLVRKLSANVPLRKPATAELVRV